MDKEKAKALSKTLACYKELQENNSVNLIEFHTADSIESGKRDPRLPQMRDSAIASQYGWTFLEDARRHDLPGIGDLQTLEEIRERRRHMKEGYGLLRPKKTVV